MIWKRGKEHMTEVEFLRRELERQLKAVDDLNKMVKDLSQITFESKMDKWAKASKGKEWVGLTEEELIVIKGKTCPEIDWIARHGVPLNNGEQNAWLFTWFMAFAKETEVPCWVCDGSGKESYKEYIHPDTGEHASLSSKPQLTS